jgi:hypothetical protein
VKLREHPEISTWPPSWLAMSGSQEKKLPPDSATLINVALSRIDPVTICYLTVQHEDETYMGTLLCKDSFFCQTIYDVLKEKFGRSIKEIADFELPDASDLDFNPRRAKKSGFSNSGGEGESE